MTFLVERPQPGNSYSGLRTMRNLLDFMPFALDITGPHPRTDYASTCKCSEVYRATDESTMWLRKNGLLRKGVVNNPCLCDCMGAVDAAPVKEIFRSHRDHYHSKPATA